MPPKDLTYQAHQWICSTCGRVERARRQPSGCATCGRPGDSLERRAEGALPTD
jgi:hypothetical protein